MGKNGGCNYKELEELKKKLQDAEINLFLESCTKELAARLLAKVIKRTPVGEYPSNSGKKGGTLRRGWTAGKNSSASTYANSLKVQHVGNNYIIEIINPTEYASYVEYGHRTRNHKGWVKGQFMLTISEEEVNRTAPRILEKKIKKKLEEILK
jgi:hypothetical protein